MATSTNLDLPGDGPVTPQARTVGRAMEILLVEDDLFDAHLAFNALQKSDIKHRLTLVRDGQETLAFLRREQRFQLAPRPDLILLDLVLPKLDGMEVLAQLKADAQLNDIPIVIMTASSEQETHDRCDALGVDSYITKPVNLESFLQVVRHLKRQFQLQDIQI